MDETPAAKGAVLMKRRVECCNLCCKHHQAGNTCGTTLQIGASGKCQSFEKSLLYYFCLIFSALSNKNYIDAMELTEEMQIGLYCVMTAYHLGFTTMEWGTCRMYALKASENGTMLKMADICAMELDQEAMDRLSWEMDEGILMQKCVDSEHSVKQSQPFGWLSPTGIFTEAAFGEHDAAAQEIIRKKGLWNDFLDWRNERNGTSRDFLSEMAGYCLVHNPSGSGGYIVSAVKPLTKRQKDFLYGYFMEIGDRFKAEQYVDTEA